MAFEPKTPVARALWLEHMKPEGPSGGRTVCQVAKLCDLTCQQVTDILYSRAAVDAETAVLLADGLNTTAEYWLRLQGVIKD